MAMVACAYASTASAASEWTYHRSADNAHPNGDEQALIWLMNRARSNPAVEGASLASSTNIEVAGGRNYFDVNLAMLRQEFNAIEPAPPAAFDYRLYDAARSHALDLIARDAQDHNGQFDRVKATGIGWSNYRGSVFSYAQSALNAHAAFNIDWGPGPGNMQVNRGHRVGLMSIDAEYSNIGVAVLYESNASTDVGEQVIVANYLKLNTGYTEHFNRFVVGTVWQDQNNNNLYDPSEGISGVLVTPSSGSYYAVTSAGGGYAFPVGANRDVTVAFSGGGVSPSSARVSVRAASVLVDYQVDRGSAAVVFSESKTGKDIVTPLEISVANTTSLGWGYGSRKNRVEARYRFSGNSQTLLLKAVGWDINRTNEVKIIVNGRLIGRLATTPARRSAGVSRFRLPRSILRPYNNLVRFIQTRPGDKWGIKNIVVQPVNQ